MTYVAQPTMSKCCTEMIKYFLNKCPKYNVDNMITSSFPPSSSPGYNNCFISMTYSTD